MTETKGVESMAIHQSHKIGGTYGNACEHCGCGSQTLTAESPCQPSKEGAAFAWAGSPDVRIHAIAFGGRAFEPITDDGKAWARNVVSCNPDYPIFRAPDRCMTGFDPDAFGVEPCDFEAFLDDLNAAGLKGEIA
jgi:hypothetical protein